MKEEGELVLRTTAAIRARRHPWVLVGLWGWQTLVALGASVPAAALVRRSIGAGPRGDAPLWDAGAHALVDFLWHAARGLAPVAVSAEIVLAFGAVVGLLPMAAAMFAMAYEARDRRAAGFMNSMVGALRAMPALCFLLLAMSAAQATAIGIGVLAGWIVEGWTHGGLSVDRWQRLRLAVVLVFVLAASGLGVVHDLARAVVVRSRTRGLYALVLGARIFGRMPLPLWWSWAWRALAALAPVVAAAAVATRIGGRGGWALAVLAVAHQAVVLGRLALRGSWLARALRCVSEHREPE